MFFELPKLYTHTQITSQMRKRSTICVHGFHEAQAQRGRDGGEQQHKEKNRFINDYSTFMYTLHLIGLYNMPFTWLHVEYKQYQTHIKHKQRLMPFKIHPFLCLFYLPLDATLHCKQTENKT